MNPSWYDLLDVDVTASGAEIRTAWKTAIADLDPTDRRFRVYNQAAEVLLDPATRAAYDAELAAAQAEEAADEAAAEAPAPEPTVASSGAAAGPPTVAAAGPPAGPRTAVPTWLLIALALATAAVLGAVAYVWSQPSDTSVEESTRAAQSAAERAIVPVLSYDATRLEEDQRAAQEYLTSDYRQEYDKLFEVIRQNAGRTRTAVSTEVIASGIVRSGEDRVEVLLFVDRPTTNKSQQDPVVYKDQVTVTMERVSGEWLIDDMVTSPVAP